ncbi:MAG: hypothetical protein ACE5JX_08795 [Acidobacteriota bacterium]
MKFRNYVLFSLLVTGSAAAASKGWLHVRVETDDQEKVRLSVPVSLVSTLLPFIEDKEFARTRIRMDGIGWHRDELTVQDLREIWDAVKNEGSTELANVQTKDADIHLFLDNQYLMVRTEEGSHDKINVKIPVSVVDALLSGQGDELNLSAAVAALQDLGPDSLVSVEADHNKVEVWIE